MSETSIMTIADFLEARLKEDASMAPTQGRAVAEIEAKRTILRRYQAFYATRRAHWMNPNFVGAMEELRVALEAIAAVYADHPDYQAEWPK